MKALLCLILSLSFSPVSAFAVTPADLHDQFVDATQRTMQVIRLEMDPRVKNPNWDLIAASFEDVELALQSLKQAGANAIVYDRNGKLVGIGGLLFSGLLFYKGLYTGGSFVVEKASEKSLGNISVAVSKSESKFVSMRPGYGVAGAVVLLGGSGYFFYARSKSKALRQAMDREIKAADELYRTVCSTYAILEKATGAKFQARFPTILKACASGKLDAFAL